MSESKSVSDKELRKPDSGVDRKLDSRKSISTSQATQIDAPNLPPDLAEVVTCWPDLPEHIKAAITTLVQAHGRGRK